MFFEPGTERLVDQAFDDRANFRGNQLVLGLGGELRIRDLNREHGCQAFAAVVCRQGHLLALADAGGLAVGGDLTGQGATETGHMGAAVALRDVVGEAEYVLVVAVVPPHRHFDDDAVLFATDGNGLVDQRLLGAIEIDDEGFEAAVIKHFHLFDV